MAISPPTDIVLGVSEAAEPSRVRLAAERLQALQEMARTRGSGAPDPAVPQETSPGLAPHATLPGAVVAKNRKGRVPDAFGKLEAFILQKFVQSMLPQNASSLFGKGIAGEFWKSMLAEKLGAELARSGQIGLARQLATQSGQALAGRGVVGDDGASVRAPSSLESLLPYLRLPSSDQDSQT